MYINRHISQTITDSASHYGAVLISGARQVGKSTVLKKTLNNIPYISLDNPKVKQYIKNDVNGYFSSIGQPAIIDEVQKDPSIFEILKFYIDNEKKSGMYFLSGSQRYDLMQGVSESLAGRVSILSLYGLSLREINNDTFAQPFAPNNDYVELRQRHFTTNAKLKQANPNSIWDIIFKGGMPRLYEDPGVDRDHYFSNYINTYIERDVKQLSNIGNTLAFEEFMVALAARTGQVLNLADISRDIGISKPTAKKWLSILVASNIVYLLHPYFPNINKRMIKSPKIYFTDTGLATYLCEWPTADVLKNSMQSGAIFETFVVCEILKSFTNAAKSPNFYYMRTAQKQEIDLIFISGDTIVPVEIKKHGFPKNSDIKNFHVLKKMYPAKKIAPGYVICMTDEVGFLADGCKNLPVTYI